MTAPEPRPRDRRERDDPPSWRPVPDPTVLTTEALHREISNLREIVEEKLGILGSLVDVHVEELKAIIAEQRRYYDAVLEERDQRYGEQLHASQRAVEAAFAAAEKAVAAAFEAREKAIQAALESAEKAILKAEVSIEKRADATYVALGELQRLLGGLMPRTEAEGRFTSALDTLTELRKTYDTSLALLSDRVKGLEAVRQGKAESQIDLRGWIVALIAFVGLAVTIIVAFGGTARP